MQQFKHRDGGSDFGRVSGKANEDRSIIRHVETRKTSDEVSLVTDGEKKNAGVKSSKDGGRTQGRGGSASPDTSPSEASRKGARKGISASHASGKKGRAGGIAEAGRRSGGAVGGKAERSPAASKLTERRKSALSSISPDGKTRSSRGGLPRHKAGSLSLAGGRMERRGRIAKAVKTAEKVGDMAGNEATSRDWGDEMSGSAAHTAANGAKDVARKRGREALKGFRKGFQEGRAAGSAGGRAVAKRAASKAAIRRANVRKARKAAQAARAAQKAGTQAARTAGAGLVKQIVAIVAAGVQALVSALGAVLAPLLIAIIAIVLIITLFTSIFSVLSSLSKPRSVGALTGVEAQIARKLREKGFGDVQIAAIIGNGIGESQLNPNAGDNGGAIGIWQLDGGNRTKFENWCNLNHRDPFSADAQIEYMFDVGWWEEQWKENAPVAAAGGYLGKCGVPEDMQRTASREEFLAETDIKRATYFWMACWEICVPETSHYATDVNRLANAERVLDALRSAGNLNTGDLAGVVNAARAIAASDTKYDDGNGTGNEPPDLGGTYTCSGLVYRAFTEAGLWCPPSQNLKYGENSQAWQVLNNNPVSNYWDAEPGWVLIWSCSGAGSGTTDHAAIYTGDGMMVDATPNFDGVAEHPVADMMGGWAEFLGAAPIPQDGHEE